MIRPLALSIALALSSTGCTVGLADFAAEPLPTPPSAPAGWQSVGSLGGTTPTGWNAIELSVAAGPLAIHAACAGNGDLVVAVGSDQGPRPSVVMACGGPADVAEGRWVVKDPVTAGTETFSAAVLEGAGTIRHPSYEISIEQPAP
jgi:hypothetical protein